MDSGELIELFYNRAYEKFVNKQILDDKNYIVPRQQLTNYVLELVNISYQDFIDFVTRTYSTGINKKVLIALIKAGCFNSFNTGLSAVYTGNLCLTFLSARRLLNDLRLLELMILLLDRSVL